MGKGRRWLAVGRRWKGKEDLCFKHQTESKTDILHALLWVTAWSGGLQYVKSTKKVSSSELFLAMFHMHLRCLAGPLTSMDHCSQA